MFQQFQLDLLKAIADTPNLVEHRLQMALPDLTHHIELIGTHLSQQMSTNFETLGQTTARVSTQMDDLMNGCITLNISGSATVSNTSHSPVTGLVSATTSMESDSQSRAVSNTSSASQGLISAQNVMSGFNYQRALV